MQYMHAGKISDDGMRISDDGMRNKEQHKGKGKGWASQQS